MEINLLKEAIDCLSDQRRLVHYHDDQYALYLLQQYCKNSLDNNETGISLSDLKTSRFAKLLQRPKVKQIVATFGDGKVTSDRLQDLYPSHLKMPVSARLETAIFKTSNFWASHSS